MIDKFKQEFKEDFKDCNLFRLGDLILFKDESNYWLYNIKTKEWEGDYTEIPKKIEFKCCQTRAYIFRGTPIGTYIDWYSGKSLHSYNLNFLFPEYSFIFEQAEKLGLTFIFNQFRLHGENLFKNINATSLVKAFDMPAKQMNIFQNRIVTTKDGDCLYYLNRIQNLYPKFKTLNEDMFAMICSIAMNDNMSNQDAVFYQEHILNKPGNLSKKLEKIIQYINSNFIEYHNLWNSLKELNHLDLSEYPEFPKSEDISNKIEAMRVRIDTITDEELYKVLNGKYSALISKLDQYTYTGNKYSIRIPGTVDELDIEGNVLHHCVGSYKHNVADGKEIILFLRKNSDPNTPYYTIDLDTDGYIRQIHTKHNGNIKDDPDKDDLMEFLNEWGNNKSNIINQKSIKLTYGALGRI